MIIISNILKHNGKVSGPTDCQIPTSLPSGENSNTGVCPEVVIPSPSLLTTIPPMFESSNLVASISSSSSFHTTVKDHTFIMATPTSYFPHSSYPSISSITTKQSQYTTEPMKMYSSSLVTVTSSSSVTYTFPYNSLPFLTLATTTLIHASHTNGSVSQTSALTSPKATPSPTMLFCSESSEDGKWPKTPACANATSNNCGNNSSRANG